MIPQQVDALKLELDNLPVLEEIEAGISDPRKMMRIGAKMYSHPDKATVQETACNAWDAHVAAGQTKPIEVTLPSVFNPEYVVRDFGTGMSLDDFRKVYMQFGYSTKEHTNDQTGCLGLGSKAPLAYTDTFTVTSIKDGHKTIGIVTRKPDWSIVLKVVAHQQTDEPNGTEVRVSVHSNIDEFVHKANDLFKFWAPGRVLVNGREPQHYVGNKIAEGLYESHDWNTSYVVMGNVPYRIAGSEFLFTNAKIDPINFVAYVEMDDGVDFTPSREDLEYTERTKDRLRRIVSDFERDILVVAKAEIDNAKDHAEAYAAWSKWTDILGDGLFKDLEFQGDKFSNTFKINAMRYQVGAYRYGTWSVNDWMVSSMANTIIVTDFAPTLASAHKIKVRDWISHKNINPSYVLFTAAKTVDSPWVDQSRVIDWETLKAEVPKATRQPSVPSGRPKGSWDYYTTNRYLEGKPLPTKGKIYWISVRKSKNCNVHYMMSQAGLTDNDAVIRVPANRLDKFKRENPKVGGFMDYCKTLVEKDGVKLLSEDAKKGLSVNRIDRDFLNMLDETKVDDPEFASLKAIVKNLDNLTKKYEANLNLAREFGMWYDVKRFEAPQKAVLTKKYPLLLAISRYNLDRSTKTELYVYMNAKYDASQKGN